MVLARVIYELFESESDVVGLADRGEPEGEKKWEAFAV